MHRYRCPAAQMNREAHAKFVEAISGFRKRYTVNGFNPADALQLVQYVDEWLANHIGRIDVQLKPCVEISRPWRQSFSRIGEVIILFANSRRRH